jgi:MFS family permease
MTPLSRLVMSARFMYAADQIALVAVPIVAVVVFDADATLIGILVACQSSAYLIGAIPFGLVIDQFQLRSIVIASTFWRWRASVPPAWP